MIAETESVPAGAPAPADEAKAPAQLLEVVQSSGVELATQKSLLDQFAPFFAQAQEWSAKAKAIVVTDESQVAEMKLARTSRLALREIRINVEHARKSAKEDSIRKGRAIDGVANLLKFLIEPIEEHLKLQESFADRAIAARKAKLKSDREDALKALGVDVTFLSLAEMPEEHFAQLLEQSRQAFEFRKAEEARRAEEARLAAEKAEQERLAREKAEAEERERIRIENERLKREAAEREEREKAERERQEAEQRARAQRHQERLLQLTPLLTPAQVNATPALLYADITNEEFATILEDRRQQAAERERLEREKREAEERARAEREEMERKAAAERAEQERKAAADRAEAEERERREREAREKAEAELRRAEEERKAKEAAALAEKQRLARAPDKEKLLAFADTLAETRLSQMSTREGEDLAIEITRRLDALVQWIRQEGGTL